MKKPFSNLFNKNKDKNLSNVGIIPEKKVTEKSKLLIISGVFISITSILLLLFTINNKFG